MAESAAAPSRFAAPRDPALTVRNGAFRAGTLAMRQLAIVATLLTSHAYADPVRPTAPHRDATYDVGVRIGGYGFRREGDTSDEGWTECRMGGVGVFASRSLTGPVFLEAGLDA